MNVSLESPTHVESLTPGGVYVLQLNTRLSREANTSIREALEPIESKTKCTFLVLDQGIAIGKLQNVSVVDGKLVVSENANENT